MQKVSYMGNGSTTEFTFNFPYFENSDVVVTMNGAAASGYNIVGTSGGLDADIPYTGGKVVFETAPTALDCITIARSLPLTRQYDYQPLAKIDPTTLNQDLNYLMEVIKDRQDELETLATQYADIADKESTTTLLARISAIHDEIVAVSAQITALGDISTLRSDVATNTENIGTNIENIATNASAIQSLRDATNFTTTGKVALAHMAMPSSRYDELTLGASGSSYTAPADGYIVFDKTSSSSGQYVRIVTDSGIRVLNNSTGSGQYLAVFAPVVKDEIFYIHYTAGGQTNVFKIIYANGAQ